MTLYATLLVRAATLACLVLVCAPSLVAAVRARGTAAAPPMLAIAVLTASAVYSQVSLLGAPATSRTWANLAAGAVAIALLVWGVLRGPDHDPDPPVDPLADLPAETRELIHRRPELLDAFAEWHDTHLQEGDR